MTPNLNNGGTAPLIGEIRQNGASISFADRGGLAFSDSLNAEISAFIRKKLDALEIQINGLELHNSSHTRTWRAYISIKRPMNLKAAYMAERFLTTEIERQFSFRPYAVYWRYQPESSK